MREAYRQTKKRKRHRKRRRNKKTKTVKESDNETERQWTTVRNKATEKNICFTCIIHSMHEAFAVAAQCFHLPCTSGLPVVTQCLSLFLGGLALTVNICINQQFDYFKQMAQNTTRKVLRHHLAWISEHAVRKFTYTPSIWRYQQMAPKNAFKVLRFHFAWIPKQSVRKIQYNVHLHVSSRSPRTRVKKLVASRTMIVSIGCS